MRTGTSLQWLQVGLAVAGLTLGFPFEGEATTFRPVTPAEIVTRAERIVIATVVDVQSVQGTPDAVHESVTLRVLETWKGKVAEQLHLRQLAAVRGRKGTYAGIIGNPLLEAGHTYLLFLPAARGKVRFPLTVGGPSGVFQARRDGTSWRFRSLAGLEVTAVLPDRVEYAAAPLIPLVHPVFPRGARLRKRRRAAGGVDVYQRWRSLAGNTPESR